MSGAAAEGDAAEPFRQWMERALYDPQRGYYSRRIQDIGRRGDFATAATLDGGLASGIAHWLRECAAEVPGIRHVVEIGPGSGELMQAVRRQLGLWRRLRWTFHLVEKSAPLRQAQQARLGAAKLRWHDSVEQALAAAQGRAWIFHNELLDAFPCDRYELSEDGWREVWVRHRAGRVIGEELRKSETPPSDASALTTGWARPGQRVEVHASVQRWLAGWAPYWQAGRMLSIDYGDEFPALYQRRPRGTVRGYVIHQRNEGAAIYESPGRQDLTADVNATDYRRWAAQLGWREVAFCSQAAWLCARGLGSSPMADAEGAGAAFWVADHAAAAR